MKYKLSSFTKSYLLRRAVRPWSFRAIAAIAGLLLFASLCSAQSAAAPAEPAPQSPLQATPLIDTAKEIVNDMVAGQFAKVEARYNAQMAAALPPGKVAAAWNNLIEHVGAFLSIDQTRVDQAGAQQIVTVVCKFERADLDARVAFDPDGKLAGLFFRPHEQPFAPWIAPAYAHPSSFTEYPLPLVNGKYGLPGTLTIPHGDGPFPVIVLVHGSGPHDQDETIGPNKPFKDLAWGIASHGIAVYRYTKRTAKYGTQISDDPASLTVDDEVIRDAQAAVALVAKQPKIDSSRVFLLGHSLGGYLAPRIASHDAQIRGLILLAAPTEPIEKLAVDQLKYIASLSGIPSAQAEKEIQMAEDSAKQIESPLLRQGDTVNFLGTNSPASYWLDLRGYHPETIAATLAIPILVLQGDRDYQVPAADFNAWKSALANKKDATIQSFPGLNHMLVSGTAPSSPEEYHKPGHVDEAVITAIVRWIPTIPGKPSSPSTSQSK